MKKTAAVVRVSAALLEAPDERQWGYDLTKRSKVRSGVLYPILSRMLDEGWVTAGWEDPAVITDKRPPRRYYVVTPAGQSAMRDMAATA